MLKAGKSWGSNSEVFDFFFFQFTCSVLLHYDTGDYSTSSRYEYLNMLLGNTARPVRKADNLTAICEPVV
jgi:hypothetical protein